MSVTGTPQSGSGSYLCTRDDIKTRLGLSGSDYDDIIDGILPGITSIFQEYCGRELLMHSSAATEYFTGCGNKLRVNRWPIVSITSIKESFDYDFENATALTADTDYRLMNDGENGIIHRLYLNWITQPDGIQVVYKGGYCAAGVTPGDGEHALPYALREAAIQQSSLIFKRRDDIGLTAISFDGDSIQKMGRIDLLPEVKTVLEKYRRISL